MSMAISLFNNQGTLESLKTLMWEASDAIMAVYNSEHFDAELKSDNSPVTRADLAAHRVLVEGLKLITPHIPLVSEEDEDPLSVPKENEVYWLIDPLDGTKEFLKQSEEFTCNLALIENNVPALGFVSIPAKNELYMGGIGLGATKASPGTSVIPISCKRTDSNVTRVVASKSHLNEETQAFIDAIEGKVELVQAGSSLKFLKIALGKADIYPRLAPTFEWDTGAAQAVLEGAGGTVTQASGEPMVYGKDEVLNPHFIAKAN